MPFVDAKGSIELRIAHSQDTADIWICPRPNLHLKVPLLHISICKPHKIRELKGQEKNRYSVPSVDSQFCTRLGVVEVFDAVALRMPDPIDSLFVPAVLPRSLRSVISAQSKVRHMIYCVVEFSKSNPISMIDTIGCCLVMAQSVSDVVEEKWAGSDGRFSAIFFLSVSPLVVAYWKGCASEL